MMHPMMMGGSGMGGKVSLLLMALAAGYAVLVLANTQERPLDKLGRILGGLILLVSFVGLLCMAVCSLGCWRKSCEKSSMADCSMTAKMCPMSASGSEAPASSAPAPAK